MSNSNVSRQALVDRLRGFALLGVVVVNAPFLLMSTEGLDPTSLTSTPDLIAASIVWVLFQAKAYLIFAFLFGYSLTIFLASAIRKGLHPKRAYAQRLGALFLFGVAHALLLFPGDILVIYAVLGTLLLVLSGRSDRTLRRAAWGFYALQVVLLAALAAIPASWLGGGPTAAAVDHQLRTGSFVDTVAAHAALWPDYLLFVGLIQGALVASMFCLGLLAGRHGLLRAVEPREQTWRRVRAWGIGVGLPLQALSGWIALAPGTTEDRVYLGLVVQYLTAPLLAAGLVAAIVLMPRRGLAKAVEADGQLSLSVYLGESLVLTVLAVGWGGGLLGLSATSTLLVAAGTWLVLLAAVHVWQSLGLGAGPAERGLRALTYAGIPTAPHLVRDRVTLPRS
ncbi:DUF418 domain-containing protein [Nocardioides sp.]|uniref:DUF418 domain-containing protein n=1 Tax=Nocardioides sp. TaxID=35761 RepID=UPI002BD5C0E2|nr:DUF418 domain-containing protein [Nocardioides sp.]HXH81041.1 DUF418 domain-containing protein [Nocardioides sp.]